MKPFLRKFKNYLLYRVSGNKRLLPLGVVGDAELIRGHFDALYYRSTYPELTGSDDELLLHYLEYGWHEGRNPSESFSTSHYLENNPDVLEAGENPLVHFVKYGRLENRSPVASLDRSDEVYPGNNLAVDMEAVEKFFDFGFYREKYKDVQGDDEELLRHYMVYGWRELRDPSADFSTSFYLGNYPDIEAHGLNPFLHFVLYGRKEGRLSQAAKAARMPMDTNARIVPNHLAMVCANVKSGPRKTLWPRKINSNSLILHWIVPDFSVGSGGHMTIFRIVRYLELFGHQCKIWIEQPTFHETGDDAWDTIVKHFRCVEAEVEFVENGFFEAEGDAVIATGWSTAFIAHRAENFAGQFYFVQDHELEFYPTGSEYLLAKQSYELGLDCICASPWLDRLMSERYGLWARHFYLAYDHEAYFVTDQDSYRKRFEQRQGEVLKIAVYAREHTARRCVPLALMALEWLSKKRQDFEVHFFGQETLPFSRTPFPAVNHGIMGAHSLGALYNECHVGICFSGTNYSLVPQEMMACGLPVLELDGEPTRAIFPENVIALGGPEPARIVETLEALLDDPERRRVQADAALSWVKKFSWEDSAKVVEQAIVERFTQTQELTSPSVQQINDVLVDVVIPTWNGMSELKPVITALRAQQHADRLQIHCIDSSSSDGTTEWLRKQRDISLTVIDQNDFQHGRTRNFGASLGTASLIAFLTQDAVPSNDTWATDIIKMFNHVPHAVGLFGRHIPYPHHPAFVREEITRHFENMLKYPLALSKFTDPEKWERGDIGWRQLLHFYSDNNSAMRREIWREIPYAEIEYGEDQVWARDIIEAGYTKLYAPTACVYHSHDYDPEQTYKRAKIEGAFFYEYFGYELGKGTEEELARNIANEQLSFKAWALRNGTEQDEIDMRLENIAQKYRGWRDGRVSTLTKANDTE